MKKIVFIILLHSIATNTFGQLVDNFSDLDFTNTPEWVGDTEKFIVNDNEELQLYDNNFNSPAYLSTACAVADSAVWSFDIRLDFNPSASNYIDIFLISDHQNPAEATNTYFIRIGDTDDNIVLYKTFEGNTTTLITGTNDLTDTNTQELHIEISYENQLWALNYENNNMGNESFFASDELSIANEFFGFSCHYTSTRKDKFFIDNIHITGNPYQDLKRPTISQCNISSPSSIYIAFSESIDAYSGLQKENYLLNNSFYPTAISTVIQNEQAYLLHFENDFPLNSNQSLSIENIADLSGNIIVPIDTNLYKPFCFPRDIVFTEIMADPNPPVLLAEFEYLEIYNRADYPVSLNEFKLHIDDQIKWFPDSILPPKTYAILCHENAVSYFPENSLCIPFSSFTIKNEAAHIMLESHDNRCIDELLYSIDAYNNSIKNVGGWALEKIDVNVFCAAFENWTPSSNQNGGTPGQTNAVNAIRTDLVKPMIHNLSVISPHEILLSYSERFEHEFQPEDFNVNFHIGSPESIEPIDHTNVVLVFENALQTKILYELSIHKVIEDCNGNTTHHPPLLFALAEELNKEDLILNEILFNPYPDGTDFIEIYNRSNKIIDLAGLRLARYENKILDQIAIVTEKSSLLYPGEYRVLCADASKISSFYNCNEAALIEMNDFPSLPDDEGAIALCFPWLEIIDRLDYNKEMHFSLLNDPEGVSLERIHKGLSNTENNWHSAAFSSGFATPTYENSQHIVAQNFHEELITISPKIITPNNDGHHDYLNIYYSFQKNNLLGTLFIYDRYGSLIRKVSNHVSLSTQELFRWDATDENGLIVPNGIYIVVFESVNEQGIIFSETKTCVVRKQ